ncbi:MAG: hypothetical protein LBE59_07245 [Nevskiaceae bacterium]|jgi:hypothetical protein|nr:hypothetical protein [Nevskiaceae bacterium]
MKTITRLLPGLLVVAVAAPAVAWAHFNLMEPAASLVQDDRGDPQKTGPCGGSNTDWGTPTYAVTKVTGGQKLRVKWQETVYHPGFYRIALAVNSMYELPPDPVAQTRKNEERGGIEWSVSATIAENPVPPVIADGLNVHRERPAQGTRLPAFETDITVPNINCKSCTLQVVQFMEEHGFNNPGGYTYHHCANLEITADKSKPLDTRWPAQRD